jgi:hypothetical protein
MQALPWRPPLVPASGGIAKPTWQPPALQLFVGWGHSKLYVLISGIFTVCELRKRPATACVSVLACGRRVRDAVDLIAQIKRDNVRALFGEPNRMRATLPTRAPVMKATLPSNCNVMTPSVPLIPSRSAKPTEYPSLSRR